MTRPIRSVLLLSLFLNLISVPANAQESGAVGSTLTQTQLRDLPSSNNLFQLLETVEGEVISDRFYGGGLNTGRIGGDDKDERSKKVRIQQSSAIVKAIAEGTIKWEKDPDFGYLVATEVPGIDDADYLQPKKMYERQGRLDEYNALVAKYNEDRRAYLRKWKGLSDTIVNAI